MWRVAVDGCNEGLWMDRVTPSVFSEFDAARRELATRIMSDGESPWVVRRCVKGGGCLPECACAYSNTAQELNYWSEHDETVGAHRVTVDRTVYRLCRLTASEYAAGLCRDAVKRGESIPHEAGRIIAGRWAAELGPGVVELAATGAIGGDVLADIQAVLQERAWSPAMVLLDKLWMYVNGRIEAGDVGAVDGWK